MSRPPMYCRDRITSGWCWRQGCLYEGDEEHRYANTCQVIDLELDAQARPRGAQVRFRSWSARGLFWGDDALLYESGRRAAPAGSRHARMAVR